MYSKYIDLILRWLRASNVAVNTWATDLPDHVYGRCFNTTVDGEVRIDTNVSTAREALMTLAHEAGHWLGNETFGYKKNGYQRERQALVYGWRVLVLVGAQRAVTRTEWFQFNKE